MAVVNINKMTEKELDRLIQSAEDAKKGLRQKEEKRIEENAKDIGYLMIQIFAGANRDVILDSIWQSTTGDFCLTLSRDGVISAQNDRAAKRLAADKRRISRQKNAEKKKAEQAGHVEQTEYVGQTEYAGQ